ncbi:hypothetical protein [Haladaptatus sp. NG-WS-4]
MRALLGLGAAVLATLVAYVLLQVVSNLLETDVLGTVLASLDPVLGVVSLVQDDKADVRWHAEEESLEWDRDAHVRLSSSIWIRFEDSTLHICPVVIERGWLLGCTSSVDVSDTEALF